MSLITNQTDESTRMLTTKECGDNIKACQERLGHYKEVADSLLAEARIVAEIAIWDRMLFHLNNGEMITINDKQELHWINESKGKTN